MLTLMTSTYLHTQTRTGINMEDIKPKRVCKFCGHKCVRWHKKASGEVILIDSKTRKKHMCPPRVSQVLWPVQEEALKRAEQLIVVSSNKEVV